MNDNPQPAPQPIQQKDAGDSAFSVIVGQVYDGPLDLLLDLIRKQDIDIYDIPIAKITEQYLKYVETIKQFDVDVAADFIYTASLLIHIKSRMLLPRDPAGPAAEDDPRLELVNRLLEHERFKTAAQMLLQKQQIEECGVVESGAEGFRQCRGHRAGVGGGRCRFGEDFSADTGPRTQAALVRCGRGGGNGVADD